MSIASAGPRVTLSPVLPRGADVAIELAGPVVETGGTARWADVDSPRRQPRTEFEGIDPRRLAFPFVLRVGFAAVTSVEPRITALRALGLPTSKTGEPPVFTVQGPVRHLGRRYVLDAFSLDEDGDNIADAQGRALQQLGTITIKEYRAADVLEQSTARRPHSVAVRHGDTLRTIAQREYGKASEWEKLAAAQKPKLRTWKIPAGKRTIRVP